MPVYEHVCPALFVHRAVADAPMLRQLTARLERSSGVGEAATRLVNARSIAFWNNIVRTIEWVIREMCHQLNRSAR